MLHFALRVNNGQIGYFEAVRREKKIPGSRICHYDVTIVHNGSERRVRNVRHNFDEGAFILVLRAILRAYRDELTQSEL